MSKNDWEAFVSLKRHTLVTGEAAPSGTLLMRRKAADGWEYRHPTPEEEREYLSHDAW